ncbi:N-acetylglutaminylglutamine amidotransferase [Salinispora arenicola]|uniref:asparagine synthase (glutamine-hydrolyzing) n=1 Tax=Salinispora arenicola TaxID=168697 RepID=A0A542XHU0_SALAC|nr:N-acetylglutaminylglutamine amidotransferase [Salinispora arenicola]MCN0151592.1 N-acetylglutaminylglutamine amidotransferase [Salinispora arenicola]NIL57642.1 N-acetylglutaminylglutamine amidotransferase [Salinispora arenicola]NIL61846.1 N-acetylglutaminylglutamine amidotransferase [Salinispora arenicola]TQL35370.1 asparagine synthase (glutamine-hydrolysing) [Salinispora arenicola]GIM84831.1 asparagine synthetase B [Salinispora arenicola]
MCGLAGEFRRDGSRADVAAVERMAATMSDRGPDDSGVWAQGATALGHRRLKIIDLSAASGQPLVDAAAGLTGVFNGCIYNYRELRAELQAKGHHFFSSGDSEVVVKAYAEWGLDFVDHLIGMFAVAITERDTGRLVLARDRLGIKPLYLAESPGVVRFASTLPALLAGGGVDTGIDPVALAHYLSFHSIVPPPRTILRGVAKLPPATIRVYEPDGRSHERVYWNPSFTRNPERDAWSAEDWQDALLGSLTTAVRRRMVADVPVGVLLSGGLDSSLVVALLAGEGQRGLSTFSIGFDSVGGREGDEFRYSDLVAKTFDSDHHQIRVPSQDLVPPLEAAVAAMSEPMVSHDCVAFYLLSQEVARHVKVVQSGQGADEILGGYHWYPPLAQVGRDQALDTYARAFLDRDAAGLARVLDPAWLAAGDPAREFVAAHLARTGAETAVDAGLRIDTQIMLTDDPVKRVDNMTMAHGLEARVPFLDHEFVELAATCPPELKLAQGGKGVLKEIGRRVLPHEVIDRPKGYFPVPGLTHLEGKLLDRVRDALSAPEARRRGLYRADYVNALLDDPNAELTPLNGNKLWQLGLLEMWLQSHGIG